MTSVLAPPPSPDAPRRRARGDKREVILDAAITVFARQGYHGARVSDIAREADIAYGLVYHYFKNKEQILRTIFEERWSGFLEAVEEIAGSRAATHEKLASVAGLILGAYRLRPEWVKVLVLDIQRSSRFAEPGQIRAVGRLFQLVARILRDGQSRGELRDDVDPDVACYVFMGALELVITSLVLDLMRIPEGGDAQGEAFPRLARTVVDIFLNGICVEGSPLR